MEHELIAKLLNQKTVKEGSTALTKRNALIDGINAKTGEEQVQSLVTKLNGLIDKATRHSTGPSQETKTVNLAAYTEPSKRENPDYMREIRRMEDKLEELYRRMDARINGLARRNSANRDEPPRQRSREELPRQRTREGRPICYNCGRVGHVQQNCNERSSRETNSNPSLQCRCLIWECERHRPLIRHV